MDVGLIALQQIGTHQPGESFKAHEDFAKTYIKMGAAKLGSDPRERERFKKEASVTPSTFRLPKKIAQALGLPDDVGDEALRIVVDDLLADTNADVKIPSSLRKALGLESDATEDAVVAAIEALKRKREEAASKNAARLVDQAIAEGRIGRVDRPAMVYVAEASPERFSAFIAKTEPHPITATEEFQTLVAAEMKADPKLDTGQAQNLVARKYPEISEEVLLDRDSINLGDGRRMPRANAVRLLRNEAGAAIASKAHAKTAADSALTFAAAVEQVCQEDPELAEMYRSPLGPSGSQRAAATLRGRST